MCTRCVLSSGGVGGGGGGGGGEGVFFDYVEIGESSDDE